MSSFQQHIYQKINEAKHKIQLCLPLFSDFELLNLLITKLQQGLAIDVLFSDMAQTSLDANMEIFYKVLAFKRLGGDFYKIDAEKLEVSSEFVHEFCLIDENILLYNFQGAVLFEVEKRLPNQIAWHSPYRSYVQHFANLLKEALPHATSQDELELEFEVDSVAVSTGDHVQISWVANNGDRLEINHAIGSVAPSGVTSLRIEEDCWIVAKASNDKQKKQRAIFIRALDLPDVHYKIFAYDHRLKDYIEVLSPKEFPHHYGITHKQPVRIEWEVKHAEQVKVGDTLYSEATGSAVFMITESATIPIIGIFGETQKKKEVFIKVFPVPAIQHIHIPLPYGMKLNANIELKGGNMPQINLPAPVALNQEQSTSLDELATKIYASKAANHIEIQKQLKKIATKKYSFIKDTLKFLREKKS